jgi:prenyltransferase beta subunit
MTKTSRSALLLAVALLAVVLLGATAPAPALAVRDRHVTEALDYICAHQLSKGGFFASGEADAPGTTPWAILAIVAGQERPTAWDKDGKDPIDYLQSLNLENEARSSLNPPAFYAKSILAFTAALQNDLIIQNAGTPRINLLAKLLTYRYDLEDDPATANQNEDINGHFSPDVAGDRSLYDVTTTTWALLALRAADQSKTGDVVVETRQWLVDAQNADGGWGIQTGAKSATDQTAAAIQALVAAGVDPGDTTIQRGLGFLVAAQRADGGFGYYLSDVRSNAESTAWTVQAIVAVGEKPADWVKNGKTPLGYLSRLQRANGSFAHRTNDTGLSAMMTTTESLIALAGRPFPFTFKGTIYRPKHLPRFTSFKPSNGAVFSATNDVTVAAEYSDTEQGTGIDVGAVRVFVDSVNKTGKAKIYSSKISLLLVDLSYGQHKIELRIADRAGNKRTLAHTITVSYAPSSGGGTSTTYPPPSSSTSRTPTPTTTLYPTPGATTPTTPAPTASGTISGTPLTPGPSGSPLPSPSSTVTGQTSDGDGGGSGGLLGVTLLAMLPVGAGLSYWLHRRQAAALSTAGRGKLLAGGGSPWQRFKGRLPGTS